MLGLLAVATTTACTSGAAPTPAARPVVSASASPSSSMARTSAQPSPARPTTSRSTTHHVDPIPPLSAKARAAGLIDIRTIIPDAIVDLRYATKHNFVGVRLYPVDARCLVHSSMTPGLKIAASQLRREGDLLVFWDCYRPHAVQVRMFQIVPDPNWVARPGPYATSHEAGRSVDVSLAHASTRVTCAAGQRVQQHCLLDMGTGFDDFTARAHAYATYGVSSTARANRARLREAMSAGGITVYSGEWWHFDGPGAFVERPHLNAPLK
jgi:zinc D-Ala-D-Ala dipeptidase